MPPTDSDTRLRAPALARPLHVVLVEPEIPPNTGNVARLCAATGSILHLVGRLGFRIDAQAVRRAGLDYWHLVQLHQHRTLEEAEVNILARAPAELPRPTTYLLSGHAERSYLDVDFREGDLLVFGRESDGLDRNLLAARREHVLGIPLVGAVRSHNLANAASIVIYEALRQLWARAASAR